MTSSTTSAIAYSHMEMGRDQYGFHVKIDYKGNMLAQLCIDNILRLHGVPSRIVSDRETQFTTQFWKSLRKALGTRLDYSSAYHP